MIQQNIPTEKYTGKSIYYFFAMLIFPIFIILLFRDLPHVKASLFLLLIIIDIYSIINYYMQDKKIATTYDWKKVRATVIKKRVILLLCESLHSHIHRFKQKTDSFKIDITYKYIYDGKEYTSNRYALSYRDDADCNFLYTKNDAFNTMNRITKNDQIDVYINPNNPEECIIQRGKSTRYSFSYGLAIVYVMTVSYFLYYVLT